MESVPDIQGKTKEEIERQLVSEKKEGIAEKQADELVAELDMNLAERTRQAIEGENNSLEHALVSLDATPKEMQEAKKQIEPINEEIRGLAYRTVTKIVSVLDSAERFPKIAKEKIEDVFIRSGFVSQETRAKIEDGRLYGKLTSKYHDLYVEGFHKPYKTKKLNKTEESEKWGKNFDRALQDYAKEQGVAESIDHEELEGDVAGFERLISKKIKNPTGFDTDLYIALTAAKTLNRDISEGRFEDANRLLDLCMPGDSQYIGDAETIFQENRSDQERMNAEDPIYFSLKMERPQKIAKLYQDIPLELLHAMKERGYDGELPNMFKTEKYDQIFTSPETSIKTTRDLSIACALNDLKEKDESEKRYRLDKIFDKLIQTHPEVFFNNEDFSYTPEQIGIVEVFNKIYNSPSRTIKNLGVELATQIVESGAASDKEALSRLYNEIEEVFLKNNIPFIGKQYKVFEILYPDKKFSKSFNESSSPELSSLHSNNARRLVIFKDLMKANFTSLNLDLEQYLIALRDGQNALNKYEDHVQLSDEEEKELKYFLKKINALSESIKNTDNFQEFDSENFSTEENIKALRQNFGVKDSEKIIAKFESTFLRRIGINTIDDAVSRYETLRQETDTRNRAFAEKGNINLEKNDLIKGVSTDFFDQQINRGFYSPEFIGADTLEAKQKSESSDITPWDTDVERVSNKNIKDVFRPEESIAGGYGDIIILLRDRGQFNKTARGEPSKDHNDRLELFRAGILGEDHYGIRTGFGSTEMDAILVNDAILKNEQKMDSLKFSIAKKGFYIPIADKGGKVIFTSEEFDQYRKIFSGIDRYHGSGVPISEAWRKTTYSVDIQKYTQTKESLKEIEKTKNQLYKEVGSALSHFGIRLHQGKYEDSIVGAQIVDTGSTGRGSALDEGYDFDFVVKIDDNDYDKVGEIIQTMTLKYPLDESYEKDGMQTFRFKGFEKDGKKIDLDVSFVKKSDTENLDANEAVAQKYDSVRKTYGDEKWLDVLTNVRWAKKALKEAECYKKGIDRTAGQQGGMGGIGVENWILQNGGDAILAFKQFYEQTQSRFGIKSFKDFKTSYKVFGAGENIRGGVKAENFIYNMDEEGYKKMVKLAETVVGNL